MTERCTLIVDYDISNDFYTTQWEERAHGSEGFSFPKRFDLGRPISRQGGTPITQTVLVEQGEPYQPTFSERTERNSCPTSLITVEVEDDCFYEYDPFAEDDSLDVDDSLDEEDGSAEEDTFAEEVAFAEEDDDEWTFL